MQPPFRRLWREMDLRRRFEIPAVRPGEYYGLAYAKGDTPAESLNQSLINQSIRVTVRPNDIKTFSPR